jgi:hypothetical protein
VWVRVPLVAPILMPMWRSWLKRDRLKICYLVMLHRGFDSLHRHHFMAIEGEIIKETSSEESTVEGTLKAFKIIVDNFNPFQGKIITTEKALETRQLEKSSN